MVEIEGMVGTVKWEVEFVNDVFPDIVQAALDTASADLGLLVEKDDALSTLESAFTRTREAIKVFFNHLISLFPLWELPFFSCVASDPKWIAGMLLRDADSDADFAKVSQAWLSTTTGIKLFNPSERKLAPILFRDDDKTLAGDER
jgi:hypothetical protein